MYPDYVECFRIVFDRFRQLSNHFWLVSDRFCAVLRDFYSVLFVFLGGGVIATSFSSSPVFIVVAVVFAVVAVVVALVVVTIDMAIWR